MAVLIVDAILRGSRLYYSWMAFDALKKYDEVHLLTRMTYRSDLFGEMFSNDAPIIHKLIPRPDEFWYGSVPDDEIKCIIELVWGLNEIHDFRAIYFPGINEYFPNILKYMDSRWPTELKKKPIVAVEYEAKAFLKNADAALSAAEREGLRERVARYRAATAAIPGLAIALLDERVADHEEVEAPLDPERFFVMPDPIPDKASVRVAETVSEADDFVRSTDAPAILLVGVQSERKGLRDVVGALRIEDIGEPEPHVFLSGRLEPAVEPMRGQILKLRRRLSWREAYVSEKQIRRSYASTDFVLLPYAKSFSGSSGVMAYATAFGKPMIATDHGCIGYRVKKFDLGLTFPSGDWDALAGVFRRLPRRGSDEYQQLERNCLRYAERNSIEAHQSTLVGKLRLREIATNRVGDGVPAMIPVADVGLPTKATNKFSLDIAHVLPTGRPALSPATVKHTPLVALLDTSVSSLNMGDHVIMDCVRNHLRQAMPTSVFVSMATHDYMGSEALRIADAAHLRIVGGTNLLASHMDEYKQWKIAGNELLLLKDVVLCGVGWWQYQDVPNNYTRLFLRSVLSREKLHSVRDSYTARQLRSVGFDNVLNTACVTMWSLTDDHLAGVPTEKAENVITTFTDYKPDAKNDRAMYEVLKRHYKKVYFWLQGRADYEYSKEILGPEVEFVGPTVEALDDALSGIDSLDYVGNRLHAGVRSLQHKRRTLIVSVDNRATEISKDTNLPVIERGDIGSLTKRITEAQRTRLTMPWDNIRMWLDQFAER